MYIVLKRFKEVFKGAKDECRKHIIDNYVDLEYKHKAENIISITFANGSKAEFVEYDEMRLFSYRILRYDFFWRNNETNTPNMDKYPDWVQQYLNGEK